MRWAATRYSYCGSPLGWTAGSCRDLEPACQFLVLLAFFILSISYTIGARDPRSLEGMGLHAAKPRAHQRAGCGSSDVED